MFESKTVPRSTIPEALWLADQLRFISREISPPARIVIGAAAVIGVAVIVVSVARESSVPPTRRIPARASAPRPSTTPFGPSAWQITAQGECGAHDSQDWAVTVGRVVGTRPNRDRPRIEPSLWSDHCGMAVA